MARRLASWGRVQRAAAVALVVIPLASVVLRAARSPDLPFIAQSDQAPWIAPPHPVSAELEQWGRVEAPRVVFERAFAWEGGEGPVVLRLRALRRFAVALNGAPLEGAKTQGGDWRRERRFELDGLLRRGRNELRIEVRNLRGPALLSPRLDGLAEPLVGDASWQVFEDGRPLGAAVRADDTRINPHALGVDGPARAARELLDTLLGLLALGAIASLAAHRWLPAAARARLSTLALVAAAGAWLGLFVAKFARLPLLVGFDVSNHLAYVEFLRAQHRLPLATDGWSMYHPPLFYAASWLAANLGERLAGGPAPLALKLVPFLCGLGNLWVAHALARRLFPDDLRVALLAVVFAAVLPMNLYGAAYFSNEMPHAFLVGVGLVIAVGLLCAPRASPRGALALGAALGLAALTKFTALLVLPVALFFLLVKLALVERAGAARSAGLAGACAAAALALAGWFYARSWIEFGQPVVGNWSLPPGQVWWQQPGFHTLAYYTGFGESLRHPYLAGFHSFWDGIYSTLWGDGGIAGRVFPSQRHPLWNYDFMSVGFALALPATALLLYGAARCARLALRRGEDPGRRAALSFLLTTSYAIGLGILYLTLQLPFFAQAKAFYGLCLAGPLSLFFAVGAARCDQALAAWPPLRTAFHALLALWASVHFLSFAA